MSIRDVNKIFDVSDATTGQHEKCLEYFLFTDYGEQDFKISIGDFLLLQHVKTILLNRTWLYYT